MTYGYDDATAVLGPLSPTPEPGALDLCAHHAQIVTVPRGWTMIRLATDFEPAPPSDSDLMALARAIRETSTQEIPEPAPAKREIRRASDVGLHRPKAPFLSVVPDDEGE